MIVRLFFLSLLLLSSSRVAAQSLSNRLPFADFVQQNIHWPDSLPLSTNGQVLVKFEVDKHGEIHNPVVVESLHPLADAEALRLVRLLDGYFTPGIRNGRKVAVGYIMPLSFCGSDSSATKNRNK